MLSIEELRENIEVELENSEYDEQSNRLINQEDVKELELEEQLRSEIKALCLSSKLSISDESFHQHPMDHSLPTEVLVDILSRLPVKSLLRFKSVSKSWFDLLCSSEFIKFHLGLSANNNKDCSVMEESELDYHMKNSGIFFGILGSTNGLICLINEANELFLWNPTIRKYKTLPDFRANLKYNGYFTYGFGYDEIHDDYKVVCNFSIYGYRYDVQEVNVYSLKNDSWHKVRCPQNGTRLIGSGKFANGKLHWATTAGFGIEKGWSITSFDLIDEKWRKVERPCSEEGDGVLVLGVIESNLSMIFNSSTTHVDVWVMKEYGNWRKIYTFNFTLDPADYFFSQSFYLSKRGEFCLMLDSRFMIYYPEEDLIRYSSQFSDFDYGLLMDFYIQSLVSPLSQNEPRTLQE